MTPGQPSTLDWGDRTLRALAIALTGYAVAGKGFAYLGAAPLFVTEAVLVLGLLAMAQSRCMLPALLSAPGMILAVLMLFALTRTVPFVGTYGIDALRDSVLVMYALFAFVVTTLLMQRPERLADALRFLRWFTGIIVFVGPLAYLASGALTPGLFPAMPHLPGTDIPILSIRGGELGVHLAGCAVLALVGLRRASRVWICGLVFGIALVASQSRGGMLAILLPVLFALPFTRVWRKAVAIGMAGMVALGLGYAADITVLSAPSDAGRADARSLGVRQVVDNVLSLVVPSENKVLDDTKLFRVLWWSRIVDYTYGGEHFWSGKGFGVNLSVDDGFVVGEKGAAPLRSPHNGHLNVLARMGIPGLTLWLAFLVTWLASIMACARLAWRNQDEAWGNLLLFVACYWLANVINATFDVALEGPMLGVWFWCQTGFGMAVVSIYRAAAHQPRHARFGHRTMRRVAPDGVPDGVSTPR